MARPRNPGDVQHKHGCLKAVWVPDLGVWVQMHYCHCGALFHARNWSAETVEKTGHKKWYDHYFHVRKGDRKKTNGQ